MVNWQNGLQSSMTLLGIMLIFSTFGDIFEAFVKPNIERRLGRKLTDWDRQAYLKELNKRAEFEAREAKRRERQAIINDLKTIHDYVWERP